MQPNESIFWKATSNSNSADTIQLKAFKPSGPEVNYDNMIATPLQVPSHENQYFTYVLSNPVHRTYVYMFYFTVNNGSQQYFFDPYLTD